MKIFNIFLLILLFSIESKAALILTESSEPERILAGAEISGTIWLDLNMDGIRDGSEDGMPNIPVMLYRCNGIFITSTVSQADGSYVFTDIPDETYKIVVSISGLGDGYGFTLYDGTTDNQIQSNGQSTCFSANEDSFYTFDGGITIFSHFGDKVWEDLNGNGIQDLGEPGIANVGVEVYDASGLVTAVTTNNLGSYVFNSLFPGQYYIKFNTDGEYLPTKHISGATNNSAITNNNGNNTTDYFEVTPQVSNFSLDGGFYRCAKFCGIVYNDINYSDSLNTNENGINGLGINLYELIDGDTIFYAYTPTGAKPGSPSDDGYYEFCVRPGSYIVEIVWDTLTKYYPGQPFATDNPLTYNHFTALDGVLYSHTITVNSGDTNCDINQGFYCLSKMESVVWLDENQNGLRDEDEHGVQDVTAKLYDRFNTLINTSVSDENGKIIFNRLKNGTYFIVFDIDDEYTFTVPFAGDPILESKVDGSFGYGSTPWIMVDNCIDILNIGAGIVLKPFPVEWIGIYAEMHATYNKVNWKIAKEQNVSHYLVMKSLDGKTWNVIDKTAATAVERTNIHNYEILDFRIDATLTYYRVQSVDLDGKVSVSDIVYVVRREDNTFHVQPNPANQYMTFSFPDATSLQHDGLMTLEISNHVGQIIYTSTFSTVQPITLPVNRWQVGLYQAVLRDGQDIISVKKISIVH